MRQRAHELRLARLWQWPGAHGLDINVAALGCKAAQDRGHDQRDAEQVGPQVRLQALDQLRHVGLHLLR
jgi:hypothetical protein